MTRKRKKPTKKKSTSRQPGPASRHRRRTQATRRQAPRKARGAPLRPGALRLTAKAIALAEPAKDRDPANLLTDFWNRLQGVLGDLASAGTPFKFDEGFRTVDRQQYLYGSGRPSAVPYGRAGGIVTYDDGVANRSMHQGDGVAGTGRAADCYPADGEGHVIWPPPAVDDPRWRSYAEAAAAHGLASGFYWKKFRDVTHCQLEWPVAPRARRGSASSARVARSGKRSDRRLS